MKKHRKMVFCDHFLFLIKNWEKQRQYNTSCDMMLMAISQIMRKTGNRYDIQCESMERTGGCLLEEF